MVAMPIGYDQPGVAARIAHHGVGEFMEVGDLSVEGLSHLIQGILNDPRYRIRAQRFASVMAETRGLDLAAYVIERAFLLLTRADVAHFSAK
jgi:UDP:flavonoid glycosyltransferase YjiC (YdhE family)